MQKTKKTTIGPFMALPSPEICELIGLTGYDHVIFDTEHGHITLEHLPDLLRAAELRSLKSYVRTGGSRREQILRPLDMGARGLIVPQVDGPEEARAVCYHARYAPAGGRGVAMPRAASYGLSSGEDYYEKSNRELSLFVQAESPKAIEKCQAIAAVEGVEGIFLGPYDLSFALGIPGQVHHPKIEDAARQVVKACERHGRVAGIFVGSIEEARRRREEGFGLIAFSMDTLLLTTALKQNREAWQSDAL